MSCTCHDKFPRVCAPLLYQYTCVLKKQAITFIVFSSEITATMIHTIQMSTCTTTDTRCKTIQCTLRAVPRMLFRLFRNLRLPKTACRLRLPCRHVSRVVSRVGLHTTRAVSPCLFRRGGGVVHVYFPVHYLLTLIRSSC